jgi:hypothetical protein
LASTLTCLGRLVTQPIIPRVNLFMISAVKQHRYLEEYFTMGDIT